MLLYIKLKKYIVLNKTAI